VPDRKETNLRAFAILLLIAIGLAQPAKGELKEIPTPTALGDIGIVFDTITRQPVSVGDDRAHIAAAQLTVLPKRAGEPVSLAWSYVVNFKTDVRPSAIKIEDISLQPVIVEVEATSVDLKNGAWVGLSRPHELTKPVYDSMVSREVWFRVMRFTILYVDGKQAILDQAVLLRQEQRIKLLDTVMQLMKSSRGDPAATDAPVGVISKTWQVGNKASNAQQKLTEYVLAGQTVGTWSELLTRQIFIDPSSTIPLARLLAAIRKGFGSDCKDLNWTILQQSDSEALYAWSHNGCAAYPASAERAVVRRTPEGLCRWAYATKSPPIGDAVAQQLDKELPKLRCD
jgi:hypothetical protein